MSDHIPLARQKKLPIFKPVKTLFLLVQNKHYDRLKLLVPFQHVTDLASTDKDIEVIKRLAKKLGAKDADIIHVLDADHSTFKKQMNAAEAWLLEGESLGENRCLFFYYTGHGF